MADPNAVTGGAYRVTVYDLVPLIGDTLVVDGDTTRFIVADGDTLETALTYDILDGGSDNKRLDGLAFYERTGQLAPFGDDIITIDGLSLAVDGPAPGYKNFLVTANADGPLEEPTGGSADFQNFPVPERPAVAAAGGRQQVDSDSSFTGSAWFVGPSRGAYPATPTTTSLRMCPALKT